MKNILKTKAKPTFKLGRKCRNCKKPIPDNEHAAREFCEVTRDANGNVKDCKTQYHRMLDSDEREKLRNFNANQRFIADQLETLISKKGNEVSTDDLDAYDIILNDAMQFKIAENGTLTSTFLNHTIISNPINNKHKILTNE